MAFREYFLGQLFFNELVLLGSDLLLLGVLLFVLEGVIVVGVELQGLELQTGHDLQGPHSDFDLVLQFFVHLGFVAYFGSDTLDEESLVVDEEVLVLLGGNEERGV